MRKIYLITLFIFLISNLKAQNFGGGLILGISTSQVGGDNLSGFNKAGLLAGVFANKSISSFLSLQMEMTYIQKGSNNPNMSNSEHKDEDIEDISSSYIEIPFLLKYHQNNLLNIQGGLMIGYLIEGYYTDLTGRMEDYNTDIFIQTDTGILLAIEYKYSEHISLNTRLSNSILPIGSEDYNTDQNTSATGKGKYNSILSFTLNYHL